MTPQTPSRESSTKYSTALLFLGLAACAWAATAAGSPTIAGGQVECVITVTGPGYKEEQTHVWDIPGGTFTPGTTQLLGALWSVHGSGHFRYAQGSQSLTADWRTNAEAKAQMALIVRASDGALMLTSWHSQLRVQNGVRGQQQTTIAGVPQKPVPIGVEAFEWAFPVIQGPAKSTSLSGSPVSATSGKVGPMQPAGSTGQASCRWNLAVTP